MLAAENSAVGRGTDFAGLMEQAGTACAAIIDGECAGEKKNILIISGKGKNGGDGFVIARILSSKGHGVKVLLPCGRPKDEISSANLNLLDGSIIYETADYQPLIDESDIITDAVFGTGFSGCLDEKLSALASAVNASGKRIIAVDVPSGANCDTAEIQGECFRADLTIAISALKPVHVIKPACEVCGQVTVADIGIIPGDFGSAEGILRYTLDEEDIKKILPARKAFSHKGTYGTALCVCGSYRMPGAAKIASSGAVKSGAGLVVSAFPDAAYSAIAPFITEQVMLPCPSDETGGFRLSAFDILTDKAASSSSALIGCGLGLSRETKKLVRKFVTHTEIPTVIDADALNAVSEEPEILKRAKAPLILTPHPGEMSRLTGKSADEILSDPVKAAKEFAEKYGCILVLKGANTAVAQSGDDKVYVNITGNSGLAKGGSGDLLSGIIVSLLAQGMSAYSAAVSGVFIHSGCADEVAALMSERGMTVTDIISHLPYYLGRFE